MSVKPNGTHAKEIAIHFIDATTGRATPQIMKKTVIQAKTLLSSGYTKEEIKKVIDYIVEKKGVAIYSLGYIGACINDVLKEMKEQEKQKELKKKIEEMKEQHRKEQLITEEVALDVESQERNRRKLDGFGVLPGIGKKFDFDMLER